jgi:hypothetical protein
MVHDDVASSVCVQINGLMAMQSRRAHNVKRRVVRLGEIILEKIEDNCNEDWYVL